MTEANTKRRVDRLARQLQNPPWMFWSTPRHAAQRLGQMGADAAPAVPALVEALSDRNPKLASDAVDALGNIGPNAIPGLRKALHHSDMTIRQNAAWAVEHIGPQAEPAVPDLMWAFANSASDGVKLAVAAAYAAIGAAASPAAPQVVKALASADPVREVAYVKALGAMGPSVRSIAGEAVARVAFSGSYVAKRDAEEALQRMDAAESLVPFLRDIMLKPVRASRESSRDAGGRRVITADDVRATRGEHVVTATEERKNRDLRKEIAKRLATCGRAAEPVLVQALVDSANDRFEREDLICGEILESLSKIGLSDASNVRPVVSATYLVKTHYCSPDDRAVQAIAKLAHDAIRPLVQIYLFDGEYSFSTYLVERALREAAHGDTQAVLSLVEELRGDKGDEVRSRAEELRKAFGGQ